MPSHYLSLAKAFQPPSTAAIHLVGFLIFSATLSGCAAESARSDCNSTNCVLPYCQCASKDIPGGLTREQVPQMVTISFDDSIRRIDYDQFYSKILNGSRKNPNGQNVSFTFFVSHDNTDYALASDLAGMGHELAVHSVSHRTPTLFWSSGENDEEIKREIVDMKNLLVRWAGVPADRVMGWRAPFLAASEDQLRILHKNDFLYDCTMVTNEMYWPFTLDYKSPICSAPAVCPDEAFPGLWVIPNINKVQNSSFSCSMIDSCAHPQKSTYDEWMYFFRHNFERHYNSSKAPFGLYAHSSWFYLPNMADRLRAFMDFMDYLGTLDDVYIVTMSEVLAWSRDPTPLNELKSFQPWQFSVHPEQRVCSHKNSRSCSYSQDGTMIYLNICGDDPCPDSYPPIQFNSSGEINSSSTIGLQSMTSSSLDDSFATSDLFHTTVTSLLSDQSSVSLPSKTAPSTISNEPTATSFQAESSMTNSKIAILPSFTTVSTEGIYLPGSISDSVLPSVSDRPLFSPASSDYGRSSTSVVSEAVSSSISTLTNSPTGSLFSSASSDYGHSGTSVTSEAVSSSISTLTNSPTGSLFSTASSDYGHSGTPVISEIVSSSISTLTNSPTGSLFSPASSDYGHSGTPVVSEIVSSSISTLTNSPTGSLFSLASSDYGYSGTPVVSEIVSSSISTLTNSPTGSLFSPASSDYGHSGTSVVSEIVSSSLSTLTNSPTGPLFSTASSDYGHSGTPVVSEAVSSSISTLTNSPTGSLFSTASSDYGHSSTSVISEAVSSSISTLTNSLTGSLFSTASSDYGHSGTSVISEIVSSSISTLTNSPTGSLFSPASSDYGHSGTPVVSEAVSSSISTLTNSPTGSLFSAASSDYGHSGTSVASEAVSSSISALTNPPIGEGVQGLPTRGLSPGIIAAIAIAVVVTVATAVAALAGLATIALKHKAAAASLSSESSTMFSNPSAASSPPA